MNAFLMNIITVVIHTPIWVWPLYALLLFLGLQRTRDSKVALWRMLILPLVVTLLAILTFIGGGLSALPAMLLGSAIGGMGGWLLQPDGATRRLPDGRLLLQGEWWSFGQILFLLIFRYVINVVAALDPALHADVAWHLSTFFISAALSGLFIGRAAARLRVYFVAAPATTT